ncbi:translocation/assembly module TamB domain-containing protein [Massilia sp. MS-15]|uniref:translocation/assembly module TamB domain-containing protein n=1 Tax=Massilia sp. MS-15 TaxID=2878200 RepID=UPI001CD6FE49|nr:translocation/assembly module TamB domain-containing protein [Massilia sp. MS-15]MCA1247525.1 translocation/assembly module TamB domain-containing protein [Massilia sp. MS-15]
MDTHDPSTAPAGKAPAQRPRRWPRRVAIGLVATGVVVGGALWYLGRETTLQMIAQRVAASTGGKLTLTGVTGSLYGTMHIDRIVWRTDEQLVVANKVDLRWSPSQIVSRGILVNQLKAANLRVETLKETDERSPMPASLAPPFPVSVDDARLAQAVFVSKGAETRIDNIRLRLHGDKTRWTVRDAAAATPWGDVAANGSIGAQRPFKIDASASLTQSQAKAEGGVTSRAAQLRLKAGGDLETTLVEASGQAGRAVGEARFVLSPYADIPLREMRITGRNVDPGFFNPSLPTADLDFAVNGKLDANRNISGRVDITNSGPEGTLDQQRLPLRSLRGQLGGNLSALQVSEVLLDFGAAGRFTGTGGLRREEDQEGLGTARFTLHTDRFDLKGIHASMKPTAIRGDIQVTNAGTTQTLQANLADQALRLTALATLADNVVTLREARLARGGSRIDLTGSMRLLDDKAFKASASASRFNPADFGDFPQADINAGINAAGALAPAWRLDADFALRGSRLLNQALSGQGKLHADAKRISGIDADLALGQNTVAVNGAFGGAGDRLRWRIDGRQLSALRGDLYGALTASGVATGSMSAPRTSFELEANGLGWVAAQRRNANGSLRASGEAWLAGGAGARFVEAKLSGAMARFNPAAFGSPLAGSVNGNFTASGRSGADWRGALDLRVQDSTLSNSPLWGHARISADRRHISNADVDLHVGANVVAAKGSFGAGGDQLGWRIDAPQLGALGPDFGGVLRGQGTLSGTMDAPSLSAALEGRNLRLLGTHSIRALRASASLGAGRGARDALASDIQVTDYVGGEPGKETRVASASLKTEGTRGAHTLRAAATGDAFDANLEVRGGWNGETWSGTLAALQNRGRYAMVLQAPVPLRIAGPKGSGVMGLASPETIAFKGAVIKLPAGSVTIDSLVKNGPRWASRGHADNVPLTYLAQFSPTLRDNARGDLTLGAQWALDLRAPAAAGAAPALDGMLHVFREKGDVIAGSDTPVPLGLRTFDARADVVGGALRVRVNLDGARTGSASVDGTAQLLRGRLDPDSPLRMTANADMASIAWLAAFAGQSGLELDGALRLALSGSGTIGTPRLDGSVQGDRLAVRWPEQGVRLQNGELRASLAGDQLQLQRLRFQGRQGSASAEGSLRFSSGLAAADLRLSLDKLEALSRPDRTVVLSGTASLVRNAERFALEGKVRADRALIEFAPQGRPTMSDDVIVLGQGGARPQPSNKKEELPLTIDLRADLGDEFRLRGLGIDATLAGNVRMRKVGAGAPRLNGSIRAVEGNYAAYGQKLEIERAVITFSGAYDNPALDVLAVRRRPEGEQLSETNVEAGVQVRGTAQAPQARLVSTPNVPDSEKLSWLVLGHGMEGTSGSEKDVLAAAAAALLGGKGGSGGITQKLASSLGVDELGLKQANGTASGLESTVVTVGKRISSRAYLSFEQGATTASSLVRLRYKWSPKITLQFQTGTNTALDVLYSWAFD